MPMQANQIYLVGSVESRNPSQVLLCGFLFYFIEFLEGLITSVSLNIYFQCAVLKLVFLDNFFETESHLLSFCCRIQPFGLGFHEAQGCINNNN